MENEKRETENKKARGERSFAARSPSFVETVCAACGAQIAGSAPQFCSVCGKLLREEYQPLDRLRASYHLQGKPFSSKIAPRAATDDEVENLFGENKNAASETARACVVYSLVPYLGILFCPLALLTGGIGVLQFYRKPYLGGGKTSAYSIVLSLLILSVQILLWWLLYIIPELGGRI